MEGKQEPPPDFIIIGASADSSLVKGLNDKGFRVLELGPTAKDQPDNTEECLTRNFLLARREHLLLFEGTTIGDIKDIWKKLNDKDYDLAYLEAEELPYYWQDPLYMKMVHRFRNCNRRPAQFYHQVDANNQKLFLRFRLPNRRDGNEDDYDLRHNMICFMAWISNMKGVHDVSVLHQSYLKGLNFANLSEAEIVKLDNWIELWREKPISFFFSLPADQQESLIAEYNEKEYVRGPYAPLEFWFSPYQPMRSEGPAPVPAFDHGRDYGRIEIPPDIKIGPDTIRLMEEWKERPAPVNRYDDGTGIIEIDVDIDTDLANITRKISYNEDGSVKSDISYPTREEMMMALKRSVTDLESIDVNENIEASDSE